MKKRTDCHKPSEINPADYEFVSIICPPEKINNIVGGTILLNQQMEIFNNHRAKTGGKISTHEHGGTCHICGAHAIYLAVYFHEKTNSYIKVGEDCAEKMEMGEIDSFKKIKSHVRQVRSSIRNREAINQILKDNNLNNLWSIISDNSGEISTTKGEKAKSLIKDIVSKGLNRGRLSDSQINFLQKLNTDYTNQAELKKKWDKEKSLAEDVLEGNQTITGKIISMKLKSNRYNDSWKMLIKTKSGYTVWGSVPTELLDYVNNYKDKLESCTFSANFTKSENDPKFGFFKRPKFISATFKSEVQ